MKLHFVAALLIAGYFASQACAQPMSDHTQVPESKHVEKAFLDSKENVHVIYSSGEDLQITRDGRCEDLRVDKAEQLVGWVRRGTVEDEKGRVIEEFRAEIVVYQNGHDRKVIIPGDMTIWKWKFWENGRKLCSAQALHTGTAFFRLYDLEGGRVIDECNKSDSTDCPAWAKDLQGVQHGVGANRRKDRLWINFELPREFLL